MNALRKKYDKKEVYESKIKGKVEEIAQLCRDNDIPFFFTACVENTENDSTYVAEASSPEVYGFSIEKNHFEDHVNIMNGFTTSAEAPLYDMDAFDGLM